ncbi:MAG: hypothetical protein Kow00127_15410 [Bacteroidales bacterium]
MKRLVILIACVAAIQLQAQTVSEETKNKFTFGLDVFTDLWQDIPESIEPKTINPGVNIFGAYNFPFGQSNVSLSPGIGIGVHNLYSESMIHTTADSTWFEMINDTVSFKRSKLTTTWLDIPLEIRYKSEGEFRLAVGFKFGFLMKAQTKYKGEDLLGQTNQTVIIKYAKFNYVEKNRYGFTARIGYKWLNLWGYYQLSNLFTEGKGPGMYPVSLGITIIPY